MKERVLHLTILSPEKQLFDGEVTIVTLPGSAGLFSILPDHAPIVSSLKRGKVSYVSAGKEEIIEITSGFVEASNGTVSVCIS